MVAVTLVLGRIVQPPSVFAGGTATIGVPEKPSWGVLWCLTV